MIEVEYEYKTLVIGASMKVDERKLNELGIKGYRIVSIIPMTRTEYGNSTCPEVPNGSQIILQKVKFSKENA